MALPPRRVAVAGWAFAAAAFLLSAAAPAENNPGSASVQPLVISFFIDHKLPRELAASLEEARRKLGDSRCQEVLTDFSDLDGRRLDLKLAAVGQSAPAYLGLVLFYDGRATAACGNPHVLAWTNPGSRVVRICWDQFATVQHRDPSYAANIVIHETLHTLGLGEGPPDAREITAQVIERCGR